MKAPRLCKKLLAGVLCVGMLAQNVPIHVSANEVGEIVKETECIEAENAEIETQTTEKSQTEALEAEVVETEVVETTVIETESTETEDIETQQADAEAGENEISETETYSDAGDLRENPNIVAEIDMQEEFPDDVFRSKIFGQLNLGEADVVTEEMLARIQTIDFSRDSFDEPAIKNIKGITLLKGLVSIDLSYNEISDVKSIDWSSLSELNSVNFNGNEITDIPNFYQNAKLKEVYLSENLLTENRLKSFASSNVPNSDVALSDDTVFSQRTDGFKVKAEPVYYIQGTNAVPVTVMVGGYKSGLEYSIAFQLDGVEVPFVHKEINRKSYENIYWIEDTGLSEGEHSVLITLEQGGQVLGEITKSFRVERQDCYPKKNSYSFSINSVDDVIDLYYTYNPQNTVDSITLTNDSGKEYAYPDVSFKTSVETKDYRYMDIEGNAGLYITDSYMNHTSFSMRGSVNVLPTGTYDLRVSLKDGTQYFFEDMVRIRSSVVDKWSYSISSDVLYWNDAQRNTAEIIVTDNSSTPKFDIDDTSVAVIETDAEDANKAYIRALKEGTAVIKITVGSSNMKAEITVLKRQYSEVLSMDTSELTIEGTRKTKDVDVEILPPAALEIREELEITSSDTKVFTVEKQTETEKGIRVTIKSVGLGTAMLTVKVKNQDVSTSRMITVTEGSFSETEKEKLLKKVGTVYCITNVNGTRLGDLKLPEGWEWVSPETQVAVLNDAPAEVQRYSARYSQESYVSFTMPIPVAVTQITGVSISGPMDITAEHEGEYNVSLIYKGYYVESNAAFVEAVDNVVSFDWSLSNALILKDSKARSIIVRADAVNEVTNGSVSVIAVAGEDVFLSEYSVLVLTEHITQIKITPTDNRLQYPVKYTYNETENAVYVDEAGLSDESYRLKFAISAGTDDNEVEVQKGTFTWTINNPALGEIKEAADGTVQLFIYGSGTIILRATANDVGEKYAEIAVEVRDYSPILETNTIVLKKYAQGGTQLPIYYVEGNEIISIRVNNDNFTATRSNGKYFMSIVNKDMYQKDTTIDAKLTVNTQMGSTVEYPVKLVIDTDRPAVKFVQVTAPNLFYTDATAEYRVVSDYNITGIAQSTERETGFNLVSYEEGILTFKAKGLNQSTLGEFKNKNSDYCNVSLLVKYDGYDVQTETIKVAAKNKKPSLNVQETAVTSTTEPIVTYLTDAGTKKEMPLSSTCKVSSLTDGVTAERSSGRISLLYSGEKNKSYKLLVSDENWTQDLTLSGKISVVKSLSTLLDAKKISLNMAHNIQKNGRVLLKVSAKNSTISVTGAEWEAADKKAQALIDSNYLSIKYNPSNSTLDIGLGTQPPQGVKAGNYKLKVYAIVQDSSQQNVRLIPVNLTVSLVDAAKSPKVKLSGKGKINLIDRKGSSVIYTPSVSNMTAAIKGVELTGDSAGIFDAQLTDDGKIEVKAIEGVAISTANHTVGFKLKYRNNVEISASVKIKPVNKTPRLAAGKTAGTIYKAANNELKWSVYNRGGFGEITDIALTKDEVNQDFVLTRSNDNQVTLKLADASKRTVKTGKHTVIYQIKFKDMASDAKPAIMKMAVTIK